MQRVYSVHVWWLLGACRRRNPLVRTSDRVELLTIALGVLIAMVATACAGALGTAVHEARSHVYLAEAQTRHTLTARAAEDSTTVVGFRHHAMTIAHSRWQVDGIEHSGDLTIDGRVKTGDPLPIWVDRDGNRVDAPTPTSRAGADAVGVAYAAWQAALLVTLGSVCWVRSRIDSWRFSGWERDLRILVYGGGSHPSL